MVGSHDSAGFTSSGPSHPGCVTLESPLKLSEPVSLPQNWGSSYVLGFVMWIKAERPSPGVHVWKPPGKGWASPDWPGWAHFERMVFVLGQSGGERKSHNLYHMCF